jgi:DNA polymerase
MILVAHHDFETRNVLDLKHVGLAAYVRHPSMGVWCMGWWFVGQRMQMWRPGDPDPVALLNHVHAGGKVGVHNAAFEREVWNTYLRRHVVPHWPELHVEQQDCTMARAAVLGMPQKLEIIAHVLGLPEQKDMEGHKVMLAMARPKKIHADGRVEWQSDPTLLKRTEAYCKVDVMVETSIDNALPALTEQERRVWILDQKINDRGIKFDRVAVQRAMAVREVALAYGHKHMADVTGGAVRSTSQVQALRNWIIQRGFPCDSLDKEHREELLLRVHAADAVDVEEAIECRIDGGQTSPTKKFNKIDEVLCDDDRARHLYAYHGAFSGRWAGRLIQPHNLYRVDPERDGPEIAWTLKHVLTLPPEEVVPVLRSIYGGRPVPGKPLAVSSPLKMLAKITRNMIIAGTGKKLVGGDLANIEGRLAAWVGGEQWKLDAFMLYDMGVGPDLYCVAYGKAFAEDPAEVKKQQQKRQIGKVMELALGYQGSVGSFLNMGKNYGLKPQPLVPVIQNVAPERFAEWCDRWPKARDKRGMAQEPWAAIKTIVQSWREGHPGIVQCWWDLQDAAVEAVMYPTRLVSVAEGRVFYMMVGEFLYCRLPSGRCLAYAKPRIVEHREMWCELDGISYDVRSTQEADLFISLGWTFKERMRRRVDYEGYEGEKRIWSTFSLYGGMQFNHIVQGAARDVLVGGMFRAEDAGYPLIMHTHDELLAEVDKGFGSPAELERLMTAGEPWSKGCPLAAKCWEGDRYSK